MKKYLFAMLAVVMCTLSMSAANEKTSKESAFASQIVTYLRSEGYAPSIDDDGDVKFKYQGDTYYVCPYEYADGYYVKILEFMGASDTSRRALLEACSAATSAYKFVRCYPSGSSVAIETTSYFNNIYQFKQVFENFMGIMSSAEKKLKETYNEYD